MERIICLLIGYAFGLFQTGYIYGKIKRVDIRQHGSGNSGATNTLRVLGKKAAFLVFLGDAFKMIFACLLIRVVFGSRPEFLYLLLLYTALGVILGHNYPFYMNFQGGKGIAATGGLLLALDLRVTLVCLVVFVVTVAVTRYVSLASLIISTLFFAGMVFRGSRGAYGLAQSCLPEFYIVAFVIAAMAFWRHRANIVRLAKGTENKVGQKK